MSALTRRALGAVALGGAVAALMPRSALSYPVTQPGHWDIRNTIIQLQARQLNEPFWLIGDSITEQYTWSKLAGPPARPLTAATRRPPPTPIC